MNGLPVEAEVDHVGFYAILIASAVAGTDNRGKGEPLSHMEPTGGFASVFFQKDTPQYVEPLF